MTLILTTKYSPFWKEPHLCPPGASHPWFPLPGSLFPSSTWKELPILLPILLAQHGSLFCSARLLSSSSNPPHRSAPCVISSDDSWPLLTSPEAPKGRHLSALHVFIAHRAPGWMVGAELIWESSRSPGPSRLPGSCSCFFTDSSLDPGSQLSVWTLSTFTFPFLGINKVGPEATQINLW